MIPEKMTSRVERIDAARLLEDELVYIHVYVDSNIVIYSSNVC